MSATRPIADDETNGQAGRALLRYLATKADEDARQLVDMRDRPEGGSAYGMPSQRDSAAALARRGYARSVRIA